MADWALYLDESGDLDRLQDAVTVAGLLVSHGEPLMQDVERVIRRTLSGDAAPIRFRAERVARYDAAIEVQFVLADFIANQARAVLGRAACDLAAAEASLGIGLGLLVRSGSPPRPHLAATGYAQRYLAGDLATFEPGRGRRLWAVEQAREWGVHA